jgi:cell division protein FtsN
MRIATALLLLTMHLTSHAQDSTAFAGAEHYFNEAGRQYVLENRMEALKTLDKGLRKFPDDERLRKLAEELLKQQQQQQKQQQQQQEQQQQQQEQQQEQQDDQAGKQEQKRQEEKEQQGSEDNRKDGGKDEQSPGRPGEIAPKDAERMLDALEREEQRVQAKLKERQRAARKVPIEKDW